MSILKLLKKENIELKNSIEDIEVVRLNTISSGTSNELSFFEDEKFLEDLKVTKAGAVFVREKHLEFVPSTTTPLVVDRPYLSLALISKYFAQDLIQEDCSNTISPSAKLMNNVFVGNSSTIGDNTQILHGSYIGNNVTIGKNTIIHPNVTIYDNSVIGNDVIIHGGTVIGSDGFGYVQDSNNHHVKIYHTGNIKIEDEVEIGANCTFDRAVFGTTIVKKGTKIDNLVHLAHNVEIGEYCAIAGQTGFAGSSKVGKHVMFGAQAGVSGHLEIGDGTIIAARSGVTKTVEGGKVYAGFPLFEHKKWLKIQAKIARLVK
ncbi:MAG: UDP-3-O-(3-hydroxymyristoyl)glucosamine N-acyltransferase [Campylobacterales bacterium]|nr:UDP-3-O-(3-hydroxymyristoyl)glucosamine N-acyltransferase [Campylobacterales bacterium]